MGEGGLHLYHCYTSNVDILDICIISVATRPEMVCEVDVFGP